MGCPGESRGFFFTKKKTGMPYPDILNSQQCGAADPAAGSIHYKEPEKLQHHKNSGSLAHVGKSEGSEKIQTDPPISMKNSKAPVEHHADLLYSSGDTENERPGTYQSFLYFAYSLLYFLPAFHLYPQFMQVQYTFFEKRMPVKKVSPLRLPLMEVDPHFGHFLMVL